MIELIGEPGTEEYTAATRMSDLFTRLWPGLAGSPASRELVRIVANGKISGYRVSDFDIILSGCFPSSPRAFIPDMPIPVIEGGTVNGRPVQLRNFTVAIELKSQDPLAVRCSGDKVTVLYTRRGQQEWKSATDQNVAQVHALVAYFKDLLHERVYVHRCLLMQGLNTVPVVGAVGGTYTAVNLLTQVAATSGVRRTAAGYVLSSGTDTQARRILAAPIFRRIVPTSLDRRRMDAVVTEAPEFSAVEHMLGRKLIRLRGHGGTGKTIMMLRAARSSFIATGSRSLFLTYNHALAADVRRLLALLHVPSNPYEGGIKVQTVMSFISGWLVRLGIDSDAEYDLSRYEENCRSALEALREGAITDEDINGVRRNHEELYDFDCIIADEAQDWPWPEAELVKSLYGHRRLCVGDGVDQLIRSTSPTNWTKDVPEEEVEVVSLTESRRMKRNLSTFLNHLARDAGLEWHVKPNDSAGGGRILVMKRPYHEYADLHAKLVQEAKERGNDELDFLFCVPSTDIHLVDGARRSGLGELLSKSGVGVWDGVDDSVRRDFPRSKDLFRVVHYESCRGLEGWTVVLQHLDEYWTECERHRTDHGLTNEEVKGYADLKRVALDYAWQRAFIAMTRAIDTMVISLSHADSAVSLSILRVARSFPDFVEILD